MTISCSHRFVKHHDRLVGKLMEDECGNLFWDDLQEDRLHFVRQDNLQERSLIEDAVCILNGRAESWSKHTSLSLKDGAIYAGGMNVCARVWASGKIELEVDKMGDNALCYSGIDAPKGIENREARRHGKNTESRGEMTID